MAITVINGTSGTVTVSVNSQPSGKAWLVLTPAPLGGAASFSLPPPLTIFGTYVKGGANYTTNRVAASIPSTWTIDTTGQIVAADPAGLPGQITVSNQMNNGLTLHAEASGHDYFAVAVGSYGTMKLMIAPEIELNTNGHGVMATDGQIATVTSNGIVITQT